MLAFIDDSGDPGFKLERWSSQYFVIAVVIFDDELEAEKTAVAIKDLRRTLFHRDDVEFKFNSSSIYVREQCFATVKPFAFRIRAIVIQKKRIYSAELRTSPSSFYSYAIKSVLKHTEGRIADAKVRIDRSGDRRFRRRFLGSLRRELESIENSILKNCKFENSSSNVLIQLADMIAGALRRSHEGTKPNAQAYRDMLKGHIEDEWSFH